MRRLPVLLMILVLFAVVPVVHGAAAGNSKNLTCVIKGNISNKKEKIYHLPDCKSYRATKIDRPGERWFCSENEASKAGWRKAKNCD